MGIRVIELDPADTFFSARDRLLRSGRGRTVLLLPERAMPLSGIDLVLLRRLADRERLDVGLVTANKALSRQARALGLPVFVNLTLAEHYRPGWWRPRRRSEVLGFAPGDTRRPWAPTAELPIHDSKASGRRFFARLAILLVILLMAALPIAAAIYTYPSATLALMPETRPAQVILTLTTDSPEAEPSETTIPARTIRHELEWTASGPTASGPATADPEADLQRIRAQALQGLGAAAPDRLAPRIAPGEMLVPASARVKILEESLERDETGARLTLRVELSGTVVAAADVNRIAYRRLAEALPDGYEPDISTVTTQLDSATGAANAFQVTAQATGRPIFDQEAIAGNLRGMRAGDAARYLTTILPLAEPPTIDVQPSWWWSWSRGRLPLRADRIHVETRQTATGVD